MLNEDTSGAVMTEYIIIVSTIAVASFISFLLLGWAFVKDFELVRRYIVHPFP